MELNCLENHLKDTISKKYKDRILTIGRVAHITMGTKPRRIEVHANIEIDVQEDAHMDHILALIHLLSLS